jgi:hypothetical protein
MGYRYTLNGAWEQGQSVSSFVRLLPVALFSTVRDPTFRRFRQNGAYPDSLCCRKQASSFIDIASQASVGNDGSSRPSEYSKLNARISQRILFIQSSTGTSLGKNGIVIWMPRSLIEAEACTARGTGYSQPSEETELARSIGNKRDIRQKFIKDAVCRK